MIRNILSVLAALAAAVCVFLLIESINTSIHPSDNPLDLTDRPLFFWILILVGWMIGSSLAGYLVEKISKSGKQTLSIIVGSLLTLSGVSNFYLIAHPVWFMIVGLPVFMIFTILGYRIANNLVFKNK